MDMYYWCVVLFYVYSIISVILPYNIDTRSAVIHRGPSHSMFGYSVDLFHGERENWLLVGAPKAQTSQRGVQRGGAVYRCPFNPSGPPCKQVPFDKRGSNIQLDKPSGRYLHNEDKSHQWFGATVHSSSGVIVACAPRYVWYGYELTHREPVGTCYVTNTSSGVTHEYSPCRTGAWGHHRQGFCQAGFSAALSYNANHLMMGAVGSWYWQGQLHWQSLLNLNDYGHSPEAATEYDDNYMGYSLAVGKLRSVPTEDYIVGSPKANNLTGAVYLYSWDVEKFGTITGSQIGEYFGYDVTVGDWNGDSLDDVAVGAPFYCDYTSDAYDQGRVYVYFQHVKVDFSELPAMHLKGSLRGKTRFGTSLANMKDINNDGYQDLAVGAPYDGPNEEGAVYIFHGSKLGIHSKPSQVLYADDIHGKLQSFGFSLSAGLDMDGNKYPDLLVGSFKTNRAVYLRTRPVINVYAEMSVAPEYIDLEKRICSLPNKDGIACFSLNTCISYEGLQVPKRIGLQLTWTLDILHQISPRIFLLRDRNIVQGHTADVYIEKYRQWCQVMDVYIKNDVRDKLTPIQIDVQYSLIEPKHPPPNELLPILEQTKNNTISTQAHILKKCGDDHVCIPDLNITAYSTQDSYIMGTHESVDVMVEVVNLGEDAYESQAIIELPPEVDYINVQHIEGQHLSCILKETEVNGAEVVMCDIGNPLPSAQKIKFAVKMSPTNISDSSTYMNVTVNANSSNSENQTDLSNNEIILKIPYTVETSIRITGVSKPEQIVFNSTTSAGKIETDEDLGPEVIHLFEIRNLGPSSISSASVVLQWPSYLTDSHEQPLFYITRQPQVISDQGEGVCVATAVNHMNLSIISEVPQVSMNSDMMQRLRRDEDTSGNYTSRRKRATSRHAVGALNVGSDWEMEGYEDREVADAQFMNMTTMNFKRDLMAQQNKRRVTTIECESDSKFCTSVHCDTGLLHEGDSMLIQIHARVVQNTIIQSEHRLLMVRSSAISRVVDVPYAVQGDINNGDTAQVSTYLLAVDRGPPAQTISIWVLALSISAGTILLFLLILLLWSCGFFKRKPPREISEVEKLRAQNNKVKTKSNAYEYDTIPNDDAL